MTFAAAMGPSLSPLPNTVAVRVGACADVVVAEAFALALDGILAATAARDRVTPGIEGATIAVGVEVLDAGPVRAAATSVSLPRSALSGPSEVTVSKPAESRIDVPSAMLRTADLVVLPATSFVTATIPPRVAIDDALAAPDSPEPEGAPASLKLPAAVASTSTSTGPDLAAPAPALVGTEPAAAPSAARVAIGTPFVQPPPVAALSDDAAVELPRSDPRQSAIDTIASVAVDTASDGAPAPRKAATTSAVRVNGPVIGPEMPEPPTVVDAEIAAAFDQPAVADPAARPRARTHVSRPSQLAERSATRERAEGGPNIFVAQTVPAPAIRVAPGPTDMSDPPKLRADDRAIVDGSLGDAASPAKNAGPANGPMPAIPTAPILDPGPPPAVPLPVVSAPRPVTADAPPAFRPEASLPRVVAAPAASPVTAMPPMAQPAEPETTLPAPAPGAQIMASALRPEIAEPPARGAASVESGRPATTAYPAAVLPSTLAAQVVPGVPILGRGLAAVAVPVSLADRGVAHDAVRPVQGAQPEPPHPAQTPAVAPPQVLEDAAVPTPLAFASVGGVAADSLMAPGTGPATPVQSAEPKELAKAASVSAAPVRLELAVAQAGMVQASWIGPVAVAPVVVSQPVEGSDDARVSRSIAPVRELSSTAPRPLVAPSNPVDARRTGSPVASGDASTADDRTAPDVRLQVTDAAPVAKPKAAKGVALAGAGFDHGEKIQPDGFVAPQAPDPVSTASAPSRALATPVVRSAAVADMPVVVAQPGRIGHDMGVAIVHRLSAGEQELVVRLEPAALGRIEVRMAFDDQGGLRAVIAADSPVALDMLRRDSADLSRALNDAGIRNDGQSLRFQTDGNSGGNTGGQPRNPWLSGDRAADRSTADRGVTDDPLPYRQIRLGGRYDLMA